MRIVGSLKPSVTTCRRCPDHAGDIQRRHGLENLLMW